MSIFKVFHQMFNGFSCNDVNPLALHQSLLAYQKNLRGFPSNVLQLLLQQCKSSGTSSISACIPEESLRFSVKMINSFSCNDVNPLALHQSLLAYQKNLRGFPSNVLQLLLQQCKSSGTSSISACIPEESLRFSVKMINSFSCNNVNPLALHLSLLVYQEDL